MFFLLVSFFVVFLGGVIFIAYFAIVTLKKVYMGKLFTYNDLNKKHFASDLFHIFTL